MSEIIEAAPQPSNFTADFSIKVTGIRTATVSGLEGTVKQVAWTLVGEEQGHKFELPQTTNLGDPSSGSFISLSALSEAVVAAWVESAETRLPGLKAHVQNVLNEQIQKAALVEAQMPWAPVVEAPTTGD